MMQKIKDKKEFTTLGLQLSSMLIMLRFMSSVRSIYMKKPSSLIFFRESKIFTRACMYYTHGEQLFCTQNLKN